MAQRPHGAQCDRDRASRRPSRTIFDSNLTTLIAAVVLFGVGSGPIRGFAVTHAIGILTTMFTAFTLTRFIVALWVALGQAQGGSALRAEVIP